MASYKIVDREYHNETYDLLHIEVTWYGKSGRRILNKYLVFKHERYVPKPMVDRKYGKSIPLDNKEWIEGPIKRW